VSGQIVYAVESGEYSDYRVGPMFSTREAAEAYAKWQDGPDRDEWANDHRVVEYALDEAEVPKGAGRWEVEGSLDEWMGKRDERDNGLGDGWWSPDSTRKTSASYTREGEVWIRAAGKDKARAMRSGREMARAIKAGTYIVPESKP
jgi:hypothetical protein